MAELLAADRAPEYRYSGRLLAPHGTHRGSLCALRCASRTRLRRRSAADWTTLLYELSGLEVCAKRQNERITAASSLILAIWFWREAHASDFLISCQLV